MSILPKRLLDFSNTDHVRNIREMLTNMVSCPILFKNDLSHVSDRIILSLPLSIFYLVLYFTDATNFQMVKMSDLLGYFLPCLLLAAK
jgi:hypothetical protein